VPYTTFSEHVRRDFADSLTAAILHDEGDAFLRTVDSPTEFFQNVAVTDLGHYNFRRQIRRDGRLCAVGDSVSLATWASVRLKAKLQNTWMATDGEVQNWDNSVCVGGTPSPLMTRSPRYEPGEGTRAHTQCP